MRYLTQFK